MNIETIPSVQLSLPDLYSLLYSFDQFFGERPIHLSDHDRPIFPIRIVPLHIGTLLRDTDKEEKYFHVEFTPHQAEVWNAKAWMDSITRRLRIAGHTAHAKQSPIEALYSSTNSKLIFYFTRQCHMRHAHAQAMAEYLLNGPENPTLLQHAGLPLDISTSLKQYRELIENRTQSPSTGAGSSVQPDT